MKDNLAIEIKNLSKVYRIGLINSRTFKSAIESYVARKKGLEDPNLEIGQSYEQLRKRFKALDNINLEIKKGEALGIIGANGAGKSTLLKILSRITTPTSGEAWINGRITSMLEVGTGFRAEFTGRENIYMNGMILGMTRKEIDEKLEEIIEFSECREFIDTPVKRYSSGMYVKLAFAVASHLNSEIMIMDEVLAVGDVNFQQKCLNKMIEVVEKEDKTVLYVSHNMATIRSLCTRCIVLEHGNIIFDGDVDEAISIYVNKTYGTNGLLNELDFSNTKRINESHGISAKILNVKFVGKNAPSYIFGKAIKLIIKWNNISNRANVFFGAKIYYSDATIIGYTSTKNISHCKNGKNEASIEFNANNLAPGKYYMVLEIYEYSSINSKVILDSTDKIFFDIQGKEETMSWNRKENGNIMLNELKVIR